MTLEAWSRDDIRNILLATHAARGTPPQGGHGDTHSADYEAGYEAALVMVASAFSIRLRSGNGRIHAPGVVIPAARLALSCRAERALERFLESREERWK